MLTDGNEGPPVYLCQVGEGVSCGACCGLYNIAGLSRPALEERLARRTRRFAEAARSEDGLEAFRRATVGWTPEERPFPQFHHCPFLGLIGQEATRVGCLLHPESPGNEGLDWRILSYYGAEACASYFCPASRCLPPRHLQILPSLFDDWYPYGLIVTEHRLVGAVFTELEGLVARAVGPDDFPRFSTSAACLRELLELKLVWPYRHEDAPGPCHFPFDNGLYPRPELRWPSKRRPSPPYVTILQEMESQLATTAERDNAIAVLDSHFTNIVDCLGKAPA